MKTLEKDGFVVVEKFISQTTAKSLAMSLSIIRDNSHYEKRISIDDKTVFGDRRVPLSYSTSANPMFERLLDHNTKKMEDLVGKKLFPTYSYARIYYNGSSLKIHKDRPSCEYSVTLCLSNDRSEWPIHIMDKNDNENIVIQQPGDALLYKGCELSHWRNEFLGESHSQVFLHYVDQNGPSSEYKYDKRQSLNTNS